MMKNVLMLVACSVLFTVGETRCKLSENGKKKLALQLKTCVEKGVLRNLNFRSQVSV